MLRFVRSNLFYLWTALLVIAIGVGLVAAFLIFTRGLGVTGLNDSVPWGLWITLDLSCIALAAGAFSLSAITYLLGRDNYRPLARVAVFVGLLGYSGALMALLLDIGRPDRFWHGWVYWNTHSMLWEVSMCITLYFSVLLLEVFPMVADLPFLARFRWLNNLAHRIHRFAPILAVLGLGLSLLHQSSLGATYGVVIGRAALWRSTMPLLFIVSAVAAGMSFTVHITMLVQWLGRRTLVPSRVLFEVGQIAGAILLIYLYMRFWDTTAGNYGYVPGRTEATNVLMTGQFAVSFWGWEMLLGGLIAAVLMIRARSRQSYVSLVVGSGLVYAGIVVNRWHTTLLAFTQPLATNPPVTSPLVGSYSPAWTEWATAFGIIALLALLFSLGMRYLPAFRGVALSTSPEPVASSASSGTGE
ncbi:MAG TPA: NrfD/PsrC family molybdoenzyme membrane anchor subunit [Spirillospora sp.]|nr:NrfD/PsrC family molybdoenzyme membrane anchor subunit [Spirillospora sp.]